MKAPYPTSYSPTLQLQFVKIKTMALARYHFHRVPN